MHCSFVPAKMLCQPEIPYRVFPLPFHKFCFKKKKRECRTKKKKSIYCFFTQLGSKTLHLHNLKFSSTLTYCSPHAKSSVMHWLLKTAGATCHLPKCKETLLCATDGFLTDSAIWFHFCDHCFLVPNTCTRNETATHEIHLQWESIMHPCL